MSALSLGGVITLWILASAIAVFGIVQRYQAKKVMARLDHTLEKAIAGEPLQPRFNEAYTSRIEEQLQQFLAIQQQQTEKSQTEKIAVKQLIANISHQTKTPLANILLYNQLITEKSQEPQIQAFSAEIMRQSEKMQFFIERLTKAAYLEDDLIQLTKSEQAVMSLLTEAVDSVKAKAEEKQIKLDLQATSLSIFYDFRWTLEAVVNVLDNAIKYSPPHTTITINCESYEFFFRITISDEGPGIREEEQAQVFERFYRGKAAQASEGLGIGLFLVREILFGQGGFVKLATNKKQGTAVSLFLPK